jgi:hypothetical protein
LDEKGGREAVEVEGTGRQNGPGRNDLRVCWGDDINVDRTECKALPALSQRPLAGGIALPACSNGSENVFNRTGPDPSFGV